MRALYLLALPLLLSGCFTAAVTGVTETGKAIADGRSLGAQVDDATIYAAINRYFLEVDSQDLAVNVTINVRQGRVLLTGNTDNENTPRVATEQAWRARGTQEVINEIKVNKNAKFWDNANDALIKKNIESRLLITKDVWVVNYSIDVVSNVAYLIGECEDQGEIDRALSVVRTTRGVREVVSYLKVKNQAPPAPTGAYGAPPAGFSNPTVTTTPVTSQPIR